jgi:DNA polymerase-3 subunit epsilon
VSSADLDPRAAALEASGEYKVLRRLPPVRQYHPPDGTSTLTALAVDVETTGFDAQRDAIIQFGGIPFEYAPQSGRIYAVGEPVTFYEDPGRPIPAEITALTGITDADVQGKRIDDQAVGGLLASATLVIAHNASFDRPFLERRLPACRDKSWACSLEDVPWKKLAGYSSRSLEFLLYKHGGVFYDTHAADSDCRALIHALATPFAGGELPLRLLLASATQRVAHFWAVGAPYEAKELLKGRRYRWNNGEDGRPRAWHKEVAENECAAEQEWLARSVYGGKEGGWKVEWLDAQNRFREHRG